MGSRLVSRFLAKGHTVRCLGRNAKGLEDRFPHGDIQFVEGDLIDESSIRGVCDGIDTAYYLVHSLHSGKNFQTLEATCAQNFVTEALAAGVKKIIYLGGLTNSDASLSPHLKSRADVGEILNSTNIPCLEFRASIIIGDGSLSFEIMKNLVERLPMMVTPKWVSSKAQPIWINDVISYLTEASHQTLAKGEIIEIGGPDIVTYKELMKTYGKIRNLKRLMISVPVLTPHLSSLWLGFVTPIYARAGRKLIESLTTDSVVSKQVSSLRFGVVPLGIRDAITASILNKDVAQSRWSDAVSSGIRPDKNPFAFHKIERKRYRFMDTREKVVRNPREYAFLPIENIGGDNGWYFANILWKIRGWIDLLIGGVGLRRNRRDPNRFVIGDTLDWWRISESVPGERVKFISEMKLPGEASLEFTVLEKQGSIFIRQTAGFNTSSWLGILYWYSLYPLHFVIFEGMLSKIVARANALPLNSETTDTL